MHDISAGPPPATSTAAAGAQLALGRPPASPTTVRMLITVDHRGWLEIYAAMPAHLLIEARVICWPACQSAAAEDLRAEYYGAELPRCYGAMLGSRPIASARLRRVTLETMVAREADLTILAALNVAMPRREAAL